MTTASEEFSAGQQWHQGALPPRSGVRITGGGVHLSKTMMLAELCQLLDSVEPAALVDGDPRSRSSIEQAVLFDNALNKRTTLGRAATLKKLAELYGLFDVPLVTRGLLALWARDTTAQPLLALLCALARDPLFRATADVTMSIKEGMSLPSAELNRTLNRRFPERFTASTSVALAQRCASSWSQSGHLGSPPKRLRRRVDPPPVAVAYAAFIAKLVGFGGAAILTSPWMQVLDLDPDRALHLLRRGEAEGLLRVRVAGHVFELELRGELAAGLKGERVVTFL